MTKHHIVTLPIRVPVTKKGKLWSVNLNIYRNTHHQTLNKAKVAFAKAIEDQVLALPVMQKIAITYTLYPKTKQLCDVSNVCSIVDKFFSDVLTEHGRLQDDNYTCLLGVQYLFGGIDKNNPRVEARISRHDLDPSTP